MNEADIISELKSENKKLKEEIDVLHNIVAEMRITLNRLILRYVSNGNSGV